MSALALAVSLSSGEGLDTAHARHVEAFVITSMAAPAQAAAVESAQNTTGQPCHDTVRFPAKPSAWTVPSGCYSRIYRPARRAYAPHPSYGWCNWWPEALHPQKGSAALHLPSHSVPKAGAVAYFAPHVQGAGPAGHYAQVVAVGKNGWVLITEMNFYWRGGGFGKVDYRFIHTGRGVVFRY